MVPIKSRGFILSHSAAPALPVPTCAQMSKKRLTMFEPPHGPQRVAGEGDRRRARVEVDAQRPLDPDRRRHEHRLGHGPLGEDQRVRRETWAGLGH